jgi:hypothetical protein
LVGAGQINQLLSRRDWAVVNAEAAQGAADAEAATPRAEPATVLTLDRAVSLQDYEDFSRSFAGVAKAQAVWIWNGASGDITVAGPDGSDIDENGAVALSSCGAPTAILVAFTVRIFARPYFKPAVTAVAADHVIDTVMAAVRAAMLSLFSPAPSPAGSAERAIATTIGARRGRGRYRSIPSQRHADAGVESAADADRLAGR